MSAICEYTYAGAALIRDIGDTRKTHQMGFVFTHAMPVVGCSRPDWFDAVELFAITSRHVGKTGYGRRACRACIPTCGHTMQKHFAR